jgi:hypothetical protein
MAAKDRVEDEVAELTVIARGMRNFGTARRSMTGTPCGDDRDDSEWQEWYWLGEL